MDPGVLLKDPGVLLKDPGVLLEDPGVLLKDLPARSQLGRPNPSPRGGVARDRDFAVCLHMGPS